MQLAVKILILVANRMYQVRDPGLGVYTPKCHTTFLSKGVQGFAIAVRGEINLLTCVVWPPTNSFSHPLLLKFFVNFSNMPCSLSFTPWSSTNLIFLAEVISLYFLCHLWPVFWLDILLS